LARIKKLHGICQKLLHNFGIGIVAGARNAAQEGAGIQWRHRGWPECFFDLIDLPFQAVVNDVVAAKNPTKVLN
jgi:hypothetical protein